LALATALLLLLAGGCTEEDPEGFGEPPPVESPAPAPAEPPQPARAQEVGVTAPGGLRFEPEALRIRSGRVATFELVNRDVQEHTLVISELAVVMLAAPGQTVSSTVAVDRQNEGDFAFFCSISGHREAGMEGTISVS
jgi:plastocyanin